MKAEERFAHLESELERIGEQLGDHLDAINRNTDEIQCCFSYLSELESKMARIVGRLDTLERNQRSWQGPAHASQGLSRDEQEVFLVLYLHDEPISSALIARRLGQSEERVESALQLLAHKGIPVMRSYLHQQVFYALDLRFKELQAKHNVLEINTRIAQQCLTTQ